MQNLDPNVHGKVMMLTDQKISKGVTMAVGEHCVRCYEYIIDYFEDDDSTDEQKCSPAWALKKNGIPSPKPSNSASSPWIR